MIDTKIHGGLCRCRICKPPLVGETNARKDRILVACILMAALVFALLIYKGLGS